MLPACLLLVIVLILAGAYFFAHWAYTSGQSSQEELDRFFASFTTSDKRKEPVNLFFVTNDVAMLCSRVLLALAWIAVIAFCLSSLEFSSFEILLGLLLLYVCVSLFMAVNVKWVSKRVFGKGKEIPMAVRKWLYGSYKLVRGFLPHGIRSFRVEDPTATLTNKKPKYKKENILKGILQFGNETVKDIMTTRLDIVDIDIRTPFPEVVRLISENSYSRMPVYSGTKDNIVGVLYIKDLLPYLGKSDKFRWSFLIRPQLSVPETKKIDNLLREFQNKKVHIAVAIDEYGGVSGIVTLEDIIEEIVGEINDEYDDERRPYVALGNNKYVFDAKTSLQDFCKLFNLDSTFFDDIEGDADTVAGLLLDLVGDLPQKHQTVRFMQFTFEVLEVDERHISKVKVSVDNPSRQDSEATPDK